MEKETAIRYVVDACGQPQGVFIDEELWQHVRTHVLGTLEGFFPIQKERPEPWEDLELLEKYWDFRYELPVDVHCEACGAQSADWKNDTPRKFLLCAANMGGLLVFTCTACQARITKRHFKDKVTVSCSAQCACE